MSIEALPREVLAISVSQLKTFLMCPRKYELRYVKGVEPAFMPVPLAFGSAFHEALAFFYGQQLVEPGPLPVEKLIEVFAASWTRFEDAELPLGGEDDDVVAEDHLDRAAAMLRAFAAHEASSPTERVVGIEVPFSIAVHDPDSGEVLEERLNGVIDLIAVEEGRKVIVEHKTSSKRWSLDQIRFDIQPSAYQLAAREMGFGEVGLRLQVVTKTKSPQVQIEQLRRDDQDEDDFLRTVVGVLRGIDAGVFYPVRGWQCRSCPFQSECAKRSA